VTWYADTEDAPDEFMDPIMNELMRDPGGCVGGWEGRQGGVCFNREERQGWSKSRY